MHAEDWSRLSHMIDAAESGLDFMARRQRTEIDYKDRRNSVTAPSRVMAPLRTASP